MYFLAAPRIFGYLALDGFELDFTRKPHAERSKANTCVDGRPVLARNSEQVLLIRDAKTRR